MENDILQIAVKDIGGTRLLRLTGELDSYTSGNLAAVVDGWIWAMDKVSVDLDGLEYIDSAGLSVLVGLWVKAMENQARLDLACSSPRISRVLEITGLLNLFQIDCTGPEARELLASRYDRTVVGGSPVGVVGAAAQRTAVHR